MAKNNHHFVPQFYLRNFSMDREAVCLINIKRAHATQNASIKDQCSRWKFYGETDDLEDAFSELEGDVAPVLRDIITGNLLPRVGTDAYFRLSFFLVVQYLRTHVSTQNMAHQSSLLGTYFVREAGKRTGYDTSNVRVTYDDDVALPLKTIRDVFPALRDLDSRILRTSCNARFITSDNPVIFYNQWCEGVDYTGVVGAMCSGLQIFYPLAPNCLLMLFDSTVYDVDEQKPGEILIGNPSDINHINQLQCVFAQKNLFFSDWNDRAHILAALPKVANMRNIHKVTLNVAREQINESKSKTESELLHTFIPMPNAHLKIKFSHIRRQVRHLPLEERSQKFRDVPIPKQNLRLPQSVEARLQGKWFALKSTETWRKD